MKLSDHTNHIRQTIQQAVENRLGRLGITLVDNNSSVTSLNTWQEEERIRFLEVFDSLKVETGTNEKGFEKLVDELTFTLFNRLAALKVAESHILIPEAITQRAENGNRSFAHSAYLEQYPEKRNEEQEGLVDFIAYEFNKQSENLPLYSLQHYYHLVPTALELKEIIDAFNAVERDSRDIDPLIWQSDDILGWLYESYNNYKKEAHKASNAKTEYDKVSIQSQVYTPKWVVKFLVDNSLGKQYLEMYPESGIKNKYQIANAPTECIRESKPLTEIKLIDPATGSGNFLLYAFDVFYDLYIDQIENYGADYNDRKIPQLIIENNLYGVDLDNRAAQIAQLGLYIKARRKKRGAKIKHFNVVSSDFVLPAYEDVKYIFNPHGNLKIELEKVVISLWDDLRQAHKFGALIRIEEIVEYHLSALEKKNSFNLFTADTFNSYNEFRKSFINDLKKAVAEHASSGAYNFMQVQAENAVTYLEILTNKYDVAVANPPYTDSADFGPELKTFVENHYKKPYKFNTNLYATFIKRCCEITTQDGKIAMIHPHTFMFIKTFEDIRKYIIDKTQIDVLVDYGLDRVNLFGPGILLDATWYVLSKKKAENTKSLYFNITGNQQEKHKKASLEKALEDVLINKLNDRVYFLDQEKLKIIDSSPFIYWISDGFREKFGNISLDSIAKNAQGMSVSNGEKYQRFQWEVNESSISEDHCKDNKRWVRFAKGGPYNKWFGNNWLLVDWQNNGTELKNDKKAAIRNQDYYFLEGLTYSSSGSKGTSFRFLPSNFLFSGGGPAIIPRNKNISLYYLMSILNSVLNKYILKCLNPTVNTTQGDLNRIPILKPQENTEKLLINLSKENTEIKKSICSFRLIEANYSKSPIIAYKTSLFKDSIVNYLNDENVKLSQILINEGVIDEKIFEIYELRDSDRFKVEKEMGRPIGCLPVIAIAKNAFLAQLEDPIPEVVDYIQQLEIQDFGVDRISEIKEAFITLYQSNNDLEEFCIRYQINPINVWYWFQEAKVLPQGRAKDIALEFVTDNIRILLAQDDDGIIPLYNQNLESRLLDRLVDHLHQQGFSSSQIAELDRFLGKPLEKYIEENFFNDLANHLNLFMYLPKTPFIWHISSGKYKAFEAYISIYQWNRDSLFKLKSLYISKRRDQLELRQRDIGTADSASAQTEKELLVHQLQELSIFEIKIDELIAEDYNPVLDSGVGKNIAPLQKKGMLKVEVLKSSQLTKYLNADW